MKNISTKKLSFVSLFLIILGVGVLLLAAYKRQHLSETSPMGDLLFTYRVMGRGGVVLILVGILILIFSAFKAVHRKLKSHDSSA